MNAEIEETNKEISVLKKELEEVQASREMIVDHLKESLNLTFKILSAMETKNYDFIESVISPNIKMSPDKNRLTITSKNGPFEVSFINEIDLEQLELRGYESMDEDHVRLFMSKINSQKGTEGYSELNFEFIRAKDGRWLLDKFITN